MFKESNKLQKRRFYKEHIYNSSGGHLRNFVAYFVYSILCGPVYSYHRKCITKQANSSMMQSTYMELA